MKREIKFRAWNKEDKIMIDLQKITPLALNDMMNTQLNLQGRSGLFIPFFKELELMQYTGLHDKNGKEIYEGDIVDNDDYIEDAHCCNNLGKTAVEFKDGCFVGMIGEIVEIIGNIYENPKLLT